jgi:hypothetical protein
MRWWLLAVGFLLALLAGAAEAPALMKAGPGVSGRGLNVRLGPAAPSVFPGDAVAFTAFWSLRPLNQSKCTGFVDAVRLRRASDNAEANINIKTDCDLNIALASSHCAATTCFVRTFFDQTGNNACGGLSCDLVQATPANQPAWLFDCAGTLPCIRAPNAGAAILAAATNFTPATGIASMWAVAGRSVGAGQCFITRFAGNSARILTSAATNTLQLNGSTGTLATTTDIGTSLNSVIGLANGATSQLNVNGTTTQGFLTTASVAGTPSGASGAATTTCIQTEAGFIDATVLTPAQQNLLIGGARVFYGLP